MARYVARSGINLGLAEGVVNSFAPPGLSGVGVRFDPRFTPWATVLRPFHGLVECAVAYSLTPRLTGWPNLRKVRSSQSLVGIPTERFHRFYGFRCFKF